MDAQKLKFREFDLGELTRRLDRHIAERQDGQDTKFELRTMDTSDEAEALRETASGIYKVLDGVNPFIHTLRTEGLRPVDHSGFSFVRVVNNDGLLSSLLPSEKEFNIGYAFIETGYSFLRTQQPDLYQMLYFRTKEQKDPLLLKNGKEIPESKIGIFIQSGKTGESYESNVPKRTDYVRNGLIWVPTDLSAVLPTEWFLNRNVKKYELKPTGT